MYAGEASVQETEAKVMRPWSAYDLAENWYGTDFRYYHGTVDPGPMKPAFVHALDEHVAAQKIPHRAKWYDAGHDLLYLVHRHGTVYKDFEDIRRQNRPAEVHLVSGDYRAARQHWLEVTRFARYPDLARLHGKVEGQSVELSTDNVAAFAVDLRELPATGEIQLKVDGVVVPTGNLASYGHRLHLVKSDSWRVGLPVSEPLAKRAGLSGPLTDPYYDRMIHVYGTPESGARGGAEEAGREGRARLAAVAVDGGAGGREGQRCDQRHGAGCAPRAVRHAGRQPDPRAAAGQAADSSREATRWSWGSKRYTGSGVGTRFLYPNPEAPGHYVMVMAAPTLDGVRRGHNLPDFLPDYVVYDASTTAVRGRLVPQKAPLARGFFDARWQLVP